MTIFELHIFGFTLAPSYYWLMYALWFLAGYFYIFKQNFLSQYERENLFFYVFAWVVLWWRLGYIFFYDFSFYITNPFHILKVWEWWMSFHGGFLWVVFAVWLFAKRYHLNFWKIIDELAVIVPVWLWAWRIGNYLNKELLWFTPYHSFLAVEKNGVYYFPSPLLESFLEWFVLLLILFFINKYKKFYGKTSCYFLIFYWLFRIFVEIFFRTPDIQIGYLFWFLTLWTLLSIPMIIGWFILLHHFYSISKIVNISSSLKQNQ
jgi:phosphatidylglycerol:prolipoprotein diacylglycerol transferase